MLDTVPVALVMGILFGFLAGLGVGGGSLLGDGRTIAAAFMWAQRP